MKKRILHAVLIGLLSVMTLGSMGCEGEEQPKNECSGNDQKLDANINGGIAVCKDGQWSAPE
jgi:hypothetical protein